MVFSAILSKSKQQGGSSTGKVPAGGLVTQGGASAGQKARTASSSPNATGMVGRSGAAALPVSDAVSDVFQFSSAYTLSATPVVDTKPITADGDYIAAIFTLSLSGIVGNSSTTADILTAISQIVIMGTQGPVMTMIPAPDWYQISQRFSELHTKPTVVPLATTTAVSGTYYVAGISLPVAQGPYTLQITWNTLANIGTATTAMIATLQLSLATGQAAGLSHYVYSNFPGTIAAAGVSDLAPIATIQAVPLTELFISGETLNTADISFITILSGGAGVGAKLTSASIVARCNAAMVTALDADKLFILFALKSNLTIARDSHLYFYFGATPNAAIRVGYYWLA